MGYKGNCAFQLHKYSSKKGCWLALFPCRPFPGVCWKWQKLGRAWGRKV